MLRKGPILPAWLLPALFAAAWLPARSASAATLEVTVHGVRNDRGHIRIGVCGKSEFLSESCVHHAVVPAHAGDVSAEIAGIPPGQYGVAAYQDEDDSGKLKRNFFGMPKEDLGFSRDPALNFGPPSFARSAILVGNSDARITLKLHRFGS
jgi:uncharacterized protein (DUF2141 family)